MIELVLPSSVKDVYDGAFLNCTSLTNVIIEEGVVNLGMSLTSTGGVFEGCTLLEYMSIPTTVKSIGTRAFYGCSSLANVAIPHGVKVIGDDAFLGCEALESIEVPGSVDSVGDGAFLGCTSLKEVKINEGAKSIGICSKYFENTSSNDNPLLGSNGQPILGGNSSLLPSLGDESQSLYGDVESGGVFEHCSSLNSISIPNSVTNIGDRAFAECTSLTNVMMTDNVKNIGHQAFYKCTSLDDIILPKELSYMGFGAFAECSSLQDIEIPGTLGELLDGAFYNCTSLTNVLIGEGVKRLGWGSWYNSGADSIGVSSSDTYGLFENCNRLTRFVIPSTVSFIDEWVFEGCTSIKDLTISNYLLQRYGIMFFPSYRDIEKLTITGQSKDLGNAESKIVWNYGFNECISLRDVEIGEGVVGLDCAFERCSSLENIKLPSTLTWIQNGFLMAGSLKSVVFSGDAPDVFDDESFFGTPKRLVFSVPEGSIGWSDIAPDELPSLWQGRQIVSYVLDSQPGAGQSPSIPDDSGSKPLENAYTLTVTNVVVHYVLNSVQPEIAIPVGEDTGYVNVITEITSGGAVCVPTEWKENYEGFEAKFGSDFGKALMKPTGKVDGAGNAMLVWQDYVAGTNPMDPKDKFMASVTIIDGKPVVCWTPELSAEQAALRQYTIYGKSKLQDSQWLKVNGDEVNYNFFKVVVEMR